MDPNVVVYGVIVMLFSTLAIAMVKFERNIKQREQWREVALPEGEDFVNQREHIPLCHVCGGLMIESNSNAMFDKTEPIPIHMSQSYSCLNCDNVGHFKIGFVNGERINGMKFMLPENVDFEDRRAKMDVDREDFIYQTVADDKE